MLFVPELNWRFLQGTFGAKTAPPPADKFLYDVRRNCADGAAVLMKSMQNRSLNANSTIALLGSLDAQFSIKSKKGKGRDLGPIPWESPEQKGRTPSDANKVESIHKLAVLYHSRKNYEQAERLYQESLTLYSMQYGMEDPKVGQCLNNIGRLYFEEGWYSEAELLFDRSLDIVREYYGPVNTKVAKRLANLAELYAATARHEEAAEYYQQALEIERNELGEESSVTTRTMRALANTLRQLERIAEAEQLEQKCRVARSPERRLQALRRVSNQPTAAASSGMSKASTPVSAGERRRRPERRLTSRRAESPC